MKHVSPPSESGIEALTARRVSISDDVRTFNVRARAEGWSDGLPLYRLSAGGEAMANGASVTEYEQMADMVAQAKAKWDQAMQEMTLLLQQASQGVDSSNAEYKAADARGANRF